MRWWDHGFRGEEVGRVLFEVILGGEDILTLVVSMVSGFLCTRFVFGEAARVQLGMRLVLLTLSSPLLVAAAAACIQYIDVVKS